MSFNLAPAGDRDERRHAMMASVAADAYAVMVHRVWDAEAMEWDCLVVVNSDVGWAYGFNFMEVQL